MAYGRLWPAHPHPLPDELLSSWFVRVAQANAIKLQTLSQQLFGNGWSPWNRDVDRSAPTWLLRALRDHTGCNYWDILHTTLVTYRTRLYRKRRATSHLNWITTVKTHGMERKAYSLQFCPACLAEDPIPYFRKQWRLALYTYCPKHRIELYDACSACSSPIVLHRGDFGRELKDALPMYVCDACGADFRTAERVSPYFPNAELRQFFDAILQSVDKPIAAAGRFDLGFFEVLHHLCRVIGTRQNQGKLLRHLAERIGMESLPTPPYDRTSIEEHRRELRHQWLLCVLWLMADLDRRLEEAWLAKAIRYNLMLKDFEGAPKWYQTRVASFSNWRQY